MVWNRHQVREALKEIVSERPYYVDENTYDGGCKYVVDGQPSCIVGVFLVDKVGVSVDEVAELDTANNGDSSVVSEWLENDIDLRERFDGDALDLLSEIQSQQDSGETWGQAFVNAVHNATRPYDD